MYNLFSRVFKLLLKKFTLECIRIMKHTHRRSFVLIMGPRARRRRVKVYLYNLWRNAHRRVRKGSNKNTHTRGMEYSSDKYACVCFSKVQRERENIYWRACIDHKTRRARPPPRILFSLFCVETTRKSVGKKELNNFFSLSLSTLFFVCYSFLPLGEFYHDFERHPPLLHTD